MVLRREKKRGRKKSFIFVSDFLGQKLSKGERCGAEPCLISACRSASVSTGTCPSLGRRPSQTLPSPATRFLPSPGSSWYKVRVSLAESPRSGPASLCRHTPLPAAEGLRTCSPGTPQPGGPGTSGPVEGQAPGDGAPARAVRGPRGWRDGQSSAASRAPPASPAPGAPRGARGPCASRAACVTRAPCVPHGPRAMFCVSHVMCVSRVLWVSRVCRMLHVHHMLCVLCVLRVPCPVSCGPCVSHAL